MIVFCDTSALMKLYIDEAHSDWVFERTRAAGACIVSEIAWAEMCAALAFKSRTGQAHAERIRLALDKLRAEWASYQRLAVDSGLIANAGDLAMRFALRAYDSVQLASAQRALGLVGDRLRFLCFDKALTAAARSLGLSTPTP